MLALKKIWLKVAALLLLAVGAGGLLMAAGGDAPEPQYVFQTIAADSTTARTVTWQIRSADVPQYLICRAEADGAEISVPAATQPLTTGEAPMYVCSATLQNLQPGARYRYRVGGGERWSAWHRLQTEKAEPTAFKALIFGDSQSGDYGVWAQTAQNAWQRNPDARFFFNMGDLVDIGSDYPQWQAWFGGGAAMMADIPAAAISGNHENYLPGGTFSPAKLYRELFRLPENGPEGLKGQAYAFDYGAVHFAALDSQEEELNEFQPDLIERQAAWLERDLRQSSKPWKIVLLHRSPFNNDSSGDWNTLGKRLAPIFDRCGVDVVFTAHIHAYGRSAPLRAGKPARGAPRGTVYISAGRSGDKTWDGARQKHFETIFDPCLTQPNYLVLEAATHRLSIANNRQDGSRVDAVELEK